VVHSLTDPPKLKKQEKHDIEVVVDRLTSRPAPSSGLTDSVETALNLADGIVVLEFVDHDHDAHNREQRFSEKLACPNGHSLAVDDLEPRSFSFNSPYGALPRMRRPGHPQGGSIPSWWCPTRIARWRRARWRRGRWATRRSTSPGCSPSLGEAMGFDVDTPWRKLPAKARKAILEGCDEQVHVR